MKRDIEKLAEILNECLEKNDIEISFNSFDTKQKRTKYYKIIQQIVLILDNEATTDFEKIEEIILLFLKNNIKTSCHDF